MASTDRMLGIGEFSRLTRLSIRMLRHYDERGVLHPARVDPVTGYRSYAADQLLTAARIRVLRDAGCSVHRIGRLLDLFDDPAALAGALHADRARAAERAAAAAERTETVDRLITHLLEEHMSVAVTRKLLPAHAVAALRATIPTYAAEGALWERMMSHMDLLGPILVPGAPSSAVFWDAEYRESDVDVEIRLEVTGPFETVEGITYRQVPDRHVLSAVLHGPYEAMAEVSASLGRELSVSGLEVDGPMFNVYLVGPGQASDPADYITEACIPVRV